MSKLGNSKPICLQSGITYSCLNPLRSFGLLSLSGLVIVRVFAVTKTKREKLTSSDFTEQLKYVRLSIWKLINPEVYL